jgi:hypothetical protein
MIDWFEDSINKRQKLPEKPYLLLQSLKKERAKERQDAKIIKGLEQAERSVNPSKLFCSMYPSVHPPLCPSVPLSFFPSIHPSGKEV